MPIQRRMPSPAARAPDLSITPPAPRWQALPLAAGVAAPLLAGVLLLAAPGLPPLQAAAALALAGLTGALALTCCRLAAERNRARAQAQRLRSVSDELPSLLAYIDHSCRYRLANAHFGRLFGVDSAAALGRTVEEVLGSEAWRVIEPELRAALAGVHRRFERTVSLTRGGVPSQGCLQVDYIPDLGPDGSVRGVVALAVDVTALKQAQLEAQQGRARLRKITDKLPALVAHIDTAERYTFANAQFGSVLGLDPEAMTGRTVRELRPEFYDAALGVRLKAALAGQAQHFEGSVHNGERIWDYQIHYVPDLDEHGRVQGCFSLTTDLSAIRGAERARVRSEQQLRRLADSLPALVTHVDAEERYTFANAHVGRVFGIDPATMLGRTMREMRADIYPQLEPHIRAALRGEVRSFEGSHEVAGQTYHYQSDYVPDVDADGAVRGFFAMTFDLTAVRRAERARAKSEERLKRITDNLPVLISYIDATQRLRFANATYREWLGVAPETLIGRTMAEVHGPEPYATRAPYLGRALAGERVEFELEDCAAGATRITRTSYIPDLDEQGAVRGLYALNTDVTQLKNAERRLQALARLDSLTGLPNRMHYDERIGEALARLAQQGGGLALMFLDVDRFKHINDELGHAAGDAVLVEFARRLTEGVRLTDLVARLAGDEFVVLLEGLHSDAEPQFVARKLLAQCQRPIEFDGRSIDVTTSVGIAYHDSSKPALSPSALLARADEALYRAKHAGRNTFRVA